MVSRRKILSRSRDDLNLDQTFSPQEEEEDVWYQKEKLYKEHIQEVLDKWTQIDDEIWAKVIVFERNRRVAKAYARAPVLTINGSDDGFDGMRIGLCGFDNPMRDQKTDEFKKHIGQGVKIKMDDAGNILIRRYAKSNVYIKSTANNQNEETSIGADILKLPNNALESEKIVKLFDMKKFQSNVNRELRRAYPDRRRLETQCLSAVAFVKSESDILECPIWVLIVNVVAMDMLKSKLPPVSVQRPLVDIKNRPRIPIPDEDPYSVAGNGSGGSSGSSGFGASALSSMMSAHTVQQQLQMQQQSQQQSSQSMTNNIIGNGGGGSNSSSGIISAVGGIGNGNANLHLNNGNVMGAGINGSGHVAATREQLLMQTQQLAHKRSEKPPKLPPRDSIYGHDIPKPDYDDIEVDTRIKLSRGKSDKGKDNKKYDDPYYCGLRARVPNFVKSSSKSAKEHLNGVVSNHAAIGTLTSQKKTSVMMPMHPAMHAPAPPHMHPHHIQQQQMMAVAAAHAVAAQQQQQQHQHPMHHHAHAQQMWQTRSYESGIGIYSHHNSTAIPTTNNNNIINNNNNTSTTNALTVNPMTTTYNTSTETHQQQQQYQQQQHLLSLQQQHQQQHHQQQQNDITNVNLGGLYYPANAGTNTTSTLYNYVAPYSINEHHHLQAMTTASTTPYPATSLSAGTLSSSSPITSASISQTSPPMLQQQQQQPPLLLSPTPLSLSSTPSLGLKATQMTNMTNNTNFTNHKNLNVPTMTNSDLATENIYGRTREITFKQVQQHPPSLNQYRNKTGSANANANYHQHSHYSHRPHQQHQHSHARHHQHHQHYPTPPTMHHHRRHSRAQDAYIYDNPSQAPAHSASGEFYYKSRDRDRDHSYESGSHYGITAAGGPRHAERPTGRPPRRSSSITGIDKNCNCVSCYALAPLFGAPTPKRPPRSLSQQQLRQHQILSGAKEPQSRNSHHKTRNMMKWCSDSDVSLLGRGEEPSQSEETDEYRTYVNRKRNYDRDSFFDLNDDFDMDDINQSGMDYKKQLEKPKAAQKFNGYAARHKYRHPSPVKDQQYPLTDGYVDKARLRQLRSPTPKRSQSSNQSHNKSNQGLSNLTNPASASNLLTMRSKSQSIESFFEQPNEEGSLYLYGGRQHIVKAPSTTEIYDRIKAKKDEQSLVDSQINLTIEQRKAALNLNETNNNREEKSKQQQQHDTLRPLLPPPLWKGAKRMNLKGFIKTQTSNNQLDINNNLLTKTENLINNLKNKNQELAKANNAQSAEMLAEVPDTMNKNNEIQQQQQQQMQEPIVVTTINNRPSRPTSRVDISDMESIYGYLKPRKPRSLSMKKIQILDY